MSKFDLHVNGQRHTVDLDPETPLVWVLRENLDLRGTKFGCGISECGSCTIMMDGQAIRSCVTTVAEAAEKKIVTVEGLADGEKLHPLQEAWEEEQVPQCGYCQPGQLMTAAALLEQKPRPTEAEIVAEMSDVLCRCGTYGRIRKAVDVAARKGGKR